MSVLCRAAALLLLPAGALLKQESCQGLCCSLHLAIAVAKMLDTLPRADTTRPELLCTLQAGPLGPWLARTHF